MKTPIIITTLLLSITLGGLLSRMYHDMNLIAPSYAAVKFNHTLDQLSEIHMLNASASDIATDLNNPALAPPKGQKQVVKIKFKPLISAQKTRQIEILSILSESGYDVENKIYGPILPPEYASAW